MKAIILAAGEGSRLRPFTNTIPKPLIKVFGKSILEHNIEYIYDSVDEIIIVVKYKKEKIIESLGSDYKGTSIRYIVQGDEKGTGAAIRGIDVGGSDLLILNGDSIFDKNDLEKIINLKGYGSLVKEVDDPSKYGIFSQDNEGFATKIIEKPIEYVGNLANLGVYKFSSDIINISNNIELSPRGEYEITDSINKFLLNNKFSLLTIESNFIDVGYPWDMLSANNYFLKNLVNSDIKGEIEENVVIKGNIILGEGSIIKSGTYIEGNVYIGKDSIVGPHTYLRGPCVIGNNSKVGSSVEIKNTSIGDGTNVAHLSYIGDSIIGNNVNIGGGFISSNLRHDSDNIKAMVKGELVDTKLKKLGVIIGDNVKTGIKTITYPGRTIDTGTHTLPGQIIK